MNNFLSTLSKIAILLVFSPIISGLFLLIINGLNINNWHNLLSETQFLQSLGLTLFTAITSSFLSLIFALTFVLLVFPGRAWQKLQNKLPWLISVPHIAFAVSLAFLITPSGFLARCIAFFFNWQSPPQWVTAQDAYGITLIIALSIKECFFLLWVCAGLLSENVFAKQLIIAKSFGYSHIQSVFQIIIPQLITKLSLPMLAVFAYSLSVVDMAMVLGPTTPPTLAVLGWQKFISADPTNNRKAEFIALLLILILLATIVIAKIALKKISSQNKTPSGHRLVGFSNLSSKLIIFIQNLFPKFILYPSLVLISLLTLWSISQSWFFPNVFPQSITLQHWLKADYMPLFTTLIIALPSTIIAIIISLFWLEFGLRKKHNIKPNLEPNKINISTSFQKILKGLVILPLLLPALPSAASQLEMFIKINLDNNYWGVVWAHLAWMLPYTIIVLNGAYQKFDTRYQLIAQSLGKNVFISYLRIKWQILIKPILLAMSVGFSVSVSQYLPTLFVGGGRFATVTTEAVALSSGGNRANLAITSLLQTILPLSFFIGVLIFSQIYQQKRSGLK